ncbi:IS5/IS1182 family transposase [Pseudonocardia sp. Ae707_Ps2]
MLTGSLVVLSYPAAIALSTHTLTQLSTLIRRRRRDSTGRWWRLTAGHQALLVLAYLRNGDTYARLAVGFGVAISTAWRYVHDTLSLLAALAENIDQVSHRIGALAWVLLDGTLVPIDRVAGQRRFYSGRHRRHGMNVQVLADPFGRLMWAAPPLPGSTHDLTAARRTGVIEAVTSQNIQAWADKAY